MAPRTPLAAVLVREDPSDLALESRSSDPIAHCKKTSSSIRRGREQLQTKTKREPEQELEDETEIQGFLWISLFVVAQLRRSYIVRFAAGASEENLKEGYCTQFVQYTSSEIFCAVKKTAHHPHSFRKLLKRPGQCNVSKKH